MIPDPELEARLAAMEPPYRSKGEAQVGRLLDRYGIPFVYEKPTFVLDQGRRCLWHPDFTLPAYNNLIIEYAGMPDRPAYMADVRYKQRVYHENMLPAFFVYPQDLAGPSWPERLYGRIVHQGYVALQGRYSNCGNTVGYKFP